MHRVETDPNYESTGIQEHLDTFAYAFPQDFVSPPQRLRAVLSYEGKIKEDKIQPRRVTFQTQLRKLRPSPTPTQGTWLRWNTSCHPNLFQKGAPETAWEAVMALFSPS
jgi:hypothetical protein